MENETFRLIVRRGPRPNEVYELTGEITNLGRDITNDIVINDREVSRHHLRFTRGAEGFTIEDLGSTNGTFVNGKRVSGASPIKNGDMIGLGETVTLQFEAGRAGADMPPPAQSAPQSQPAPSGDVDAPYRPPAAQEGQAAQQSPQPVQPAPQYVPQPEAQPQVQQQPPAQQPADAYSPPQDYYNQPQQASYGPPPPGYDYDPYAMREDEGGSNFQWLLIGCLGLLLLCCCLTVVAAVAIDSLCLYESIPILRDILRALSIPVNC